MNYRRVKKTGWSRVWDNLGIVWKSLEDRPVGQREWDPELVLLAAGQHQISGFGHAPTQARQDFMSPPGKKKPSLGWTCEPPSLSQLSLPGIHSASFLLQPLSSRLLSSHLHHHLGYLQRIPWACVVGGCHPWCSHTSMEDRDFRVVPRLLVRLRNFRDCTRWECTVSVTLSPAPAFQYFQNLSKA